MTKTDGRSNVGEVVLVRKHVCRQQLVAWLIYYLFLFWQTLSTSTPSRPWLLANKPTTQQTIKQEILYLRQHESSSS